LVCYECLMFDMYFLLGEVLVSSSSVPLASIILIRFLLNGVPFN
jgi:hypothetical protein